MTTMPGGPTAFVDDTSIPGAALLYRRIPQQWVDWNTVDTEGRPRIKRGAFQDYSPAMAHQQGYPGPCMSVCLASVLEQDGRASSSLLEGWGEAYGIASIEVSVLRDTDQGVMPWATAQEPCHAVVFSK